MFFENAIEERELRGGNRELKSEENVLFENVTKNDSDYIHGSFSNCL